MVQYNKILLFMRKYSMETFKITTDETLRETIQHGNNRYPFAYYPDNIWKFDFHRIDWHWIMN